VGEIFGSRDVVEGGLDVVLVVRQVVHAIPETNGRGGDRRRARQEEGAGGGDLEMLGDYQVVDPHGARQWAKG